MRYELRRLVNGWAVWDIERDAPAVVQGCSQEGMLMSEADDVANLLNRLEQHAIHKAMDPDSKGGNSGV